MGMGCGMMRRVVVAIVILILLAVPAQAQKPDAPPGRAKHEVIVNGHKEVREYLTGSTATQTPSPYAGYHWPRSSGNQAYIRVIFKAPLRWKAITDRAVAEWSKSGRLQFVYASSCPTWTPQRNCLWVREINEASAVVGRSVIWGSGGHVATKPGTYETTVYFNRYHASWATKDINLPCHEFGHTIGLDHPPDGSQGPCVGVPRAIDYSVVRTVYAHVDASGPPGWR